MTNTDTKLRVFFCHASQDKPVVRELYQRLLGEGWIDPWLDEEKLFPGQDWHVEIEKAVESANAVIICLSNHSVSKEGYIQRELQFILDIALEKPAGTIFIIPLRLTECDVPRQLRAWQYVDYFVQTSQERAYARIVSSLSIRAHALGIPVDQNAAVSSPEPAKETKITFSKNPELTSNSLVAMKEATMTQGDSEEHWWAEEHSLWFESLSEQQALEDIISTVRMRFPKSNVAAIQQAWLLAVQSHGEQRSKYSKRPVLRHILAVAKTVAELGLDHESVVAALVHDILEEGGLQVPQLEDQVGSRVTRIVLAISRYDKTQRKSEASFQRDIFGKLFDALSENINDLPAAFIKLAEKYDHLRFSIQHFPYIQQKDMANEIMQGYAPLAGRLGLWRLKAELEDLAFRITDQVDYDLIAAKLQSQRDNTSAFFRKALPELQTRLQKANIEAQVFARRKHIYSTFEKMRRKGNRYIGIYDFVGVRIIVSQVIDCYKVLGIVHDLWNHIPNEMDDYIGHPKSNGYQSLHTTVVSEEGFAIEIQIRTIQMHEIAEFGLAAHWRYKDAGDLASDRLNAILSSLQSELVANRVFADSDEYMKTISDNVLHEKIHVYSMPAGALVHLPKQSTPIDLAYVAEEELAPQTVAAKVGDVDVPLDWQLSNGDRVTLITSPEHEPEREWLTFVKTVQAKEALRKKFQAFPRAINIKAGLVLLQKEMAIMGVNFSSSDLGALLRSAAPDEVLSNIGSGMINPRDIAEQLFKKPYRDYIFECWAHETVTNANLPDPSLVLLSECCKPELGKDIVAVYEGPILRIHERECQQIEKLSNDKLVKLSGLVPSEIVLTVQAEIVAKDRPRLLNEITVVLTEYSADILSIHSSTDRVNGLVNVQLEIDIRFVVRLVDILHRIKLIKNVETVRRIPYPSDQAPKWKIASIPDSLPRTDSVLSLASQSAQSLSRDERATGEISHQLLKSKIVDGFDREGLEELCRHMSAEMRNHSSSMHISLAMFGADRAKDALVADLIKYLYERGKLQYLLDAAEALRPGLLLGLFPGDSPVTPEG